MCGSHYTCESEWIDCPGCFPMDTVGDAYFKGGGMGMMRQRGAEMEYQQEVQQAGSQNRQTQEKFDRAHRTCMEAKGYKIG